MMTCCFGYWQVSSGFGGLKVLRWVKKGAGHWGEKKNDLRNVMCLTTEEKKTLKNKIKAFTIELVV